MWQPHGCGRAARGSVAVESVSPPYANDAYEIHVSEMQSELLGLMPYDGVHSGHHESMAKLTALSQSSEATARLRPTIYPVPPHLLHRCELH